MGKHDERNRDFAKVCPKERERERRERERERERERDGRVTTKMIRKVEKKSC